MQQKFVTEPGENYGVAS